MSKSFVADGDKLKCTCPYFHWNDSQILDTNYFDSVFGNKFYIVTNIMSLEFDTFWYQNHLDCSCNLLLRWSKIQVLYFSYMMTQNTITTYSCIVFIVFVELLTRLYYFSLLIETELLFQYVFFVTTFGELMPQLEILSQNILLTFLYEWKILGMNLKCLNYSSIDLLTICRLELPFSINRLTCTTEFLPAMTSQWFYLMLHFVSSDWMFSLNFLQG